DTCFHPRLRGDTCRKIVAPPLILVIVGALTFGSTGANQASIAPLVITAIIFWLLIPERINRRGEISSVTVNRAKSRQRKAVEAFTPRKLEPTTAELKKLPRHGDKDRRRRIFESLRLPEKKNGLLKSSPRHPSRSRVVTPRPKPASG
ncbi:hypothetical protein HID58_014673, partial [Brassica napus]